MVSKISGGDSAAASGDRPAPRKGAKSDAISIGLKQLFSSVVEEPIPDDFLALLDQIDAKERELAERDSAHGAADTSVSGETSE